MRIFVETGEVKELAHQLRTISASVDQQRYALSELWQPLSASMPSEEIHTMFSRQEAVLKNIERNLDHLAESLMNCEEVYAKREERLIRWEESR